jgi:hypothetical protein
MEKKPNRFNNILGIAVMAALITGLTGFVTGVFAFFNADWTGAGVCLAAAALAFGLLANALLRD